MPKSSNKWGTSIIASKSIKWVRVRLQKGADRFQEFLENCVKIPFIPSILHLILAALISLFIYHDFYSPFLGYDLGQVAKRYIISPKTLEIEDPLATVKTRQQRVAEVLDVYDFDEQKFFETWNNIVDGFIGIKSTYPNLLKSPNTEAGKEIQKEAMKVFSAKTGLDLSENEYFLLIKNMSDKRFQKTLKSTLEGIYLNYIVSNKDLLLQKNSAGITLIRSEKSPPESEELFKSFELVTDWKEAKNLSKKSTEENFTWIAKPERKLLGQIVESLIFPNISFNQKETEIRKKRVSEEVTPVKFKVEKGTVVVRMHDVISERQARILEALRSDAHRENTLYQYFFTTLFIFLILFSLTMAIGPGFGILRLKPRDMLVSTLVLMGSIVSIKLLLDFAIQFFKNKDEFAHIPMEFFYLLIPIAAGPMLMRMLIGREVATLFSIGFSMFIGLLLDKSYFFACYALATSLMGLALVHHIQNRSSLYLAGIRLGFFNLLMGVSIYAMTKTLGFNQLISEELRWIIIAGLSGGLLSAIFAGIIAPFFESTFGYVTEIRLLELANLENPLLKKLSMLAPGTWHHSMMIGNLVETAAEAIGANPLLCRVMAMYHDVGKTIKPQYFIENQGEMENPHDKLSPSMSAMVIKEHVWGGIDLGKQYHIPRTILAGIPEHHGTLIITYFHNRHVQKQLDIGEEGTDNAAEAIFRHEGPKPQTKETALLMLADGIEAAVRSIKEPSVPKIESMINRIFQRIIDDGQLDEVDLSLSDLNSIRETFAKQCLNIHHHRIEYDNVPKKNSEYSNSNRPKSEESSEVKSSTKKDSEGQGAATEKAKESGRSHLKAVAGGEDSKKEPADSGDQS